MTSANILYIPTILLLGSSRAVAKALNGLEIFDKKPAYTSEEVNSRMEMFPNISSCFINNSRTRLMFFFQLLLSQTSVTGMHNAGIRLNFLC